MVGLAVGGAIILVALIVLASILSRIFGDVGGSLDKDELGLNTPTTSAESEDGATTDGSTVKPVRATVFSPEGGADAPMRPAWRSTAIRPPSGPPTPTRTPCRSPGSRTASG